VRIKFRECVHLLRGEIYRGLERKPGDASVHGGAMSDPV
jgi:hypothetical protein